MKKKMIFLLLIPTLATGTLGEIYHHKINAEINIKGKSIKVKDDISFSEPTKKFVFFLHKGINPKTNKGEIKKIETDEKNLVKFAVLLAKKTKSLAISYESVIYHPLRENAENYARSFSETSGIICEKGVYLNAESGWYPYIPKSLNSFSLRYKIDATFDCVSAGRKIPGGWEERNPVDAIPLSCSKFKEYSQADANYSYYAYLRKTGKNLAEKYLSAAKKWMDIYSGLLGDYPYRKFALVENFWESGYGFPSFTLLGPTVIKLPFIINSSYPHEILHNWWGNGVFVDYEKGNWCEGLTVYLADYMIKEQQGKGKEYRMTALKKYADYAAEGKDFPLTDFRSRHSSASEAVGYGKAMMFYHMLRRKLGDNLFIKGLREFYKEYKFKYASFKDIRLIFEKVTGKNLTNFFKQWVELKGAPSISLGKTGLKEEKGKYILSFELSQKGDIYNLDIPVAVSLENGKTLMRNVTLNKNKFSYTLTLSEKPKGIWIDPEFDVFRKLSPLETPPVFSGLLGAKKPVIILSSDMSKTEKYKRFVMQWKKNPENAPIVKMDAGVLKFPKNKSVIIMGLENKFARLAAKELEKFSCFIGDGKAICAGRELPAKENSFIFVFSNPLNPARSVALINLAEKADEKVLSRKIPHYGKYSYLSFDSANVNNFKGIWKTEHSPLKKVFSGKAEFKFQKRKALAYPPCEFSRKRMRRTVDFLSRKLKGRYVFSENKNKAAKYIEKKFREYKLAPFFGKNYFQSWIEKIGGEKGELINVVGMIEGNDEKFKQDYVVISAHYDHLRAKNSKYYPGANDNASGIAVMLELARYFAKRPTPRTLLFCAFDGEEEGRIGSRHFVKSLGEKINNINAAVNLDTVGRLNGGKILILNSASSRKWPYIFMGIQYVTGIQSVISKENLDSSDQISFSEVGIPAVQIFSGANEDHHQPSDTPDKINYNGMAKAATLTGELVKQLASGHRIKGERPKRKEKKKRKKILGSLGFLPDFSFTGAGVRIKKTFAGSAAEKSGLKTGAVIIAVNGNRTENLSSYSTVLAKYKAGDIVKVKYIFEGKEKEIAVTLQKR